MYKLIFCFILIFDIQLVSALSNYDFEDSLKSILYSEDMSLYLVNELLKISKLELESDDQAIYFGFLSMLVSNGMFFS